MSHRTSGGASDKTTFRSRQLNMRPHAAKSPLCHSCLGQRRFVYGAHCTHAPSACLQQSEVFRRATKPCHSKPRNLSSVRQATNGGVDVAKEGNMVACLCVEAKEL